MPCTAPTKAWYVASRHGDGQADAAMATLRSHHWVQFAGSGDPNLVGQPRWARLDARHHDRLLYSDNTGAWPLDHDPTAVRLDARDHAYERLSHVQ